MCIRHRSLIKVPKQQIFLYSALANDQCRKIITRWRLSLHPLYIETGRHKRPKVEREQRRCSICDVIEDEFHALYVCIAHQFIRIKYANLMISHNSVDKLLDPQSLDEIKLVAKYLTEIEKNMEDLRMNR